jgi:isocitrate dehydrogenase (NAD+)
MDVTLEVLKTVGADFNYDFVDAGEGAIATHGDTLPTETIASIERTGLALKGPLSTPSGGCYKRQRPPAQAFRSLCERQARQDAGPRRFTGVDLVLFRENVDEQRGRVVEEASVRRRLGLGDRGPDHTQQE